MSWDKNTINFSDLDSRIQMLKEFNIPFVCKDLAEVVGMGLNDNDEWCEEEHCTKSKKYTLRLLKYSCPSMDSSDQNAPNKEVCFVEVMHRTYDCDSDDTLFAVPIDLSNPPENFPLEVYDDAEGFVNLEALEPIDFEGDIDSIEIDPTKLKATKPAEKAENFVNLKKIIEEL